LFLIRLVKKVSLFRILVAGEADLPAAIMGADGVAFVVSTARTS
jgi:hypothetical protein